MSLVRFSLLQHGVLQEVSLAFIDTFDASSIMIHQNEDCWAKACFEKTDF